MRVKIPSPEPYVGHVLRPVNEQFSVSKIYHYDFIYAVSPPERGGSPLNVDPSRRITIPRKINKKKVRKHHVT